MRVKGIERWLRSIEGDWSVSSDRSLKVAAILDPFSAISFAEECELLELSIDDWKAELEAFQPDLLLVESAWLGKDGGWEGAVGHFTSDVIGVIEWAEANDVPKAFWNKEDPVKFQSFLRVARRFDAIFTTDMDCVARYREILRHDRAFFLPFAAQPRLHNPVRKYDRKEAFCFAGSYYANYRERTRTLERFLDVLPNYAPVEIYDRKFGTEEEQYRFPERYHPFIQGKLPFDEIDKAYKGYRYAINLNTVQQSQSMFARRVFELTACGTTTISNYSRGLRNMFGDYVINSDEPEQILQRLSGSKEEDRKIGLGAMRQTLSSHCYQDRLNYLAAKTVGLEPANVWPRLLIIGYASKKGDIESLLTSFDAQRYERADFVIVHEAEAGEIDVGLRGRVNLRIIDARKASSINFEEFYPDRRWIAFFHPDDLHGPHYLTDLAVALRYVDCHAVTRREASGEDPAYVHSQTASYRRSLIDRAALDDETLHELAKHSTDRQHFGRVFTIDRFDYWPDGGKGGSVGEDGDKTGTALNSALSSHLPMRSGIDLADLRRASETARIDAPSIDDEAVPTILDKLITSLLSRRIPDEVSIEDDDGSLRVCSRLDQGKFDYLYSNLILPASTIAPDGTLIVEPVCDNASVDMNLVAFFLDADQQRIDQSMVRVRDTLVADLPRGCAFIAFHLRVGGSFEARINDLALPSFVRDISAEDLAGELAPAASGKVEVRREEDGLALVSNLPDGRHDYLYGNVSRPVSLLPVDDDGKATIYLETSVGMDLSVAIFFHDDKGNRVDHIIATQNVNFVFPVSEEAATFRVAIRVGAGGAARIRRLSLSKRHAEPVNIVPKSDVLVVTNHYPSYDNLYRNGFIHSRVRAYVEAGMNVEVFTVTDSIETTFREFENINVVTANATQLRQSLSTGAYRHVLVHFLNEEMWSVLKDFVHDIPVTVWIHGFEIQPWWRRTFNYVSDKQLEDAKAVTERRLPFWRTVVEDMPPKLKLVFVSKYLADEVEEDLGRSLPSDQIEIIHNPIDDEKFEYLEKDEGQRLKILSIRPYSARNYANDLSVETILALSEKPYFEDLEFRLIGDGILFDETLEPLRPFENVKIERRFVAQSEIADIHKQYGIFLVPTRSDTQGVSRDEAMSSGLVPITNEVAAVPEFVDEESGFLAPGDDAAAMAQGLDRLINDPEYFRRLSRNAAERVRRQSSKSHIIARELELVSEARE